MTANEYQEVVREVRLPSADFSYAMLGLSGEVGELHSKVAKGLRDGNAPEVGEMTKELGDVLWFVAALADDFGVTLEELMDQNAVKLLSRKTRGVIGGSGDDR